MATLTLDPDKLDNAIKESGKLANDVARELGIDQALISRWRMGIYPVPKHWIYRLSQALEVQPADLGFTSPVQPDLEIAVSPISAPIDDESFRRNYIPDFTPEPEPEPMKIRAPKRMRIQFGMDGMPMLGPTSRPKCSCGNDTKR